MMELRQIEQVILATGKVDSHELEVLRKQIYAGGKIDRRGADFLVELHKRVQHLNPAFEQFFYQAIKDHILRRAGLTPRRPPGCGGCSSPTASLKTRGASSCMNSRARPSRSAVSSRYCSRRA